MKVLWGGGEERDKRHRRTRTEKTDGRKSRFKEQKAKAGGYSVVIY